MTSNYNSFDDLPVILSVSQIADVMGISRAGAYNLAKSQGFPSIRVGVKRLCTPKVKFIEWLEKESEKTLETY